MRSSPPHLYSNLPFYPTLPRVCPVLSVSSASHVVLLRSPLVLLASPSTLEWKLCRSYIFTFPPAKTLNITSESYTKYAFMPIFRIHLALCSKGRIYRLMNVDMRHLLRVSVSSVNTTWQSVTVDRNAVCEATLNWAWAAVQFTYFY